jgi:hypothetical protein
MRALLRSALALVTLGLASLGCNKPSAPDPPKGTPKGETAGAGPEVTFYVPGMS